MNQCKHPRVQIVSRDEDTEYVECLECGDVFESSEFKDMAIEDNIKPAHSKLNDYVVTFAIRHLPLHDVKLVPSEIFIRGDHPCSRERNQGGIKDGNEEEQHGN